MTSPAFAAETETQDVDTASETTPAEDASVEDTTSPRSEVHHPQNTEEGPDPHGSGPSSMAGPTSGRVSTQ